jgi:hypothetical protein
MDLVSSFQISKKTTSQISDKILNPWEMNLRDPSNPGVTQRLREIPNSSCVSDGRLSWVSDGLRCGSRQFRDRLWADEANSDDFCGHPLLLIWGSFPVILLIWGILCYWFLWGSSIILWCLVKLGILGSVDDVLGVWYSSRVMFRCVRLWVLWCFGLFPCFGDDHSFSDRVCVSIGICLDCYDDGYLGL